MSYPWTRVPAGEPPLDPLQLRLLPLADAFMAAMWSRPGGLSLRTSWVTPATIALCGAAALLSVLAGIFCLISGLARPSWWLALGATFCALVLLGSGSVAVYGVRQRRISRNAARL